MPLVIELTNETEARLRDAAASEGLRPPDYVRRLVERDLAPPNHVSPEARKAANARLREHVVSLGEPTGLANEAIDADLARIYGDTVP